METYDGGVVLRPWDGPDRRFLETELTMAVLASRSREAIWLLYEHRELTALQISSLGSLNFWSYINGFDPPVLWTAPDKFVLSDDVLALMRDAPDIGEGVSEGVMVVDDEDDDASDGGDGGAAEHNAPDPR